MLNFEELKFMRSYHSPVVTQTDMASRWPCSKTYISKLENGALPLTKGVEQHFIQIVREIREEKRNGTYTKPTYDRDVKSKHDYYKRSRKKWLEETEEGKALKRRKRNRKEKIYRKRRKIAKRDQYMKEIYEKERLKRKEIKDWIENKNK